MTNLLDGTLALVTGANNGTGYAKARKLAKLGAAAVAELGCYASGDRR
jgi:NAD(P)-dependent dehydrogenase (short-subunit alcohol dehydrogenase family)